MSSRICYISCIRGEYEVRCQPFATQTVQSDFICFTDNENIQNNGWIIDSTPYHISHKSPVDDGSHLNSVNTHKHMVTKYYKTQFQNIPRLKDYEVIVWIDGNINITYDKTSEYILNNIYKNKIIGWNHEQNRYGILRREVEVTASYGKYASTFWDGEHQPFQDAITQYIEYERDGYSDDFFDRTLNPHMGVWITCFVAFLNKEPIITEFLNLWYLQVLKYCTNDQVSFPYVCFKKNIVPLTLPNSEIHGERPHDGTQFYIRRVHGT